MISTYKLVIIHSLDLGDGGSHRGGFWNGQSNHSVGGESWGHQISSYKDVHNYLRCQGWSAAIFCNHSKLEDKLFTMFILELYIDLHLSISRCL